MTWKNFTMLHYIINPGAGFGEIFGQRMAKISLIDKTSDKPLMERTYIPCPHCETLHDGRVWSKKNDTAFKNWFGLYCPKCGEIIPCLHNATVYILLMITYPIWGWFKENWKQRWLNKQPQRYKNIDIKKVQYDSVSWVTMSLQFGGFMFVIMSLFQIIQDPSQYVQILLINFPTWIFGGFAFGYTMKYWMGRKGKNANKPSIESEPVK